MRAQLAVSSQVETCGLRSSRMCQPCQDQAAHEAGSECRHHGRNNVVVSPMQEEGAVGDRPLRAVLARTNQLPTGMARHVDNVLEAALLAKCWRLRPRLRG